MLTDMEKKIIQEVWWQRLLTYKRLQEAGNKDNEGSDDSSSDSDDWDNDSEDDSEDDGDGERDGGSNGDDA